MVRARSPGSVLILARSGDETTLAELRVLSGAVAALQIIGVRPMAVRETLPLRVQAVDAWGAALAGRPVAWASTDSTVAVVDEASGVVTALTPGSTRITATSEGVTAGVPVVVAAGVPVWLAAVAVRGGSCAEIIGAPVTLRDTTVAASSL